MRYLFLVVAFGLLLLGGPAVAEDKPKPNTLTPKEIADGWLLLFDGEAPFGWKIDGGATVKDGALVLGGEKETTAIFTTPLSVGELRLEAIGGGHIKFQTANSSVNLGGPVSNQPTQLTLTLQHAQGAAGVNCTKTIVGEVTQMTFGVTTSGPPLLQLVVPAGKVHTVHSVKFKPDGLKPLFNGKDLTGWKVYTAEPKRSATKYEVTKDGELSAKNGPGDLQTEGQWADFVLQLECKTNGKWLNSGVFFRCLPDKYQQGYEAQIHNGYLGDPTKPADYGTGAIYNRVKARKVVSNDNEWFTMTVVATGAHISTWVNGYQTVDWTDDRKAAENARQGLKTGKGHLSIQGHDPTTDLLFRNIRLAELPAAGEKKE